VLLVAGCGDGRTESPQAIFAHAQRGLAQIDSGTVAVHVTVKSPLQLERSSTIPAGRVPWSAIHLRKLTSNPRRVACASGLECARADLDVRQALEAFGPAIPALPVDQRQIHDATLEVAIGKHDHVPHYLKIEANVVAGGLLGVVKAEVQLDLPTT
jgi:hypothetical protein